MESTLWGFLLDYWYVFFAGFIVFAFVVIVITLAIDKLIDEIHFRIERRRYRLARK